MKVLLAFVFIVVVAAMRESRHDRPQRAMPLLVLCIAVAAVLFGMSRLV